MVSRRLAVGTLLSALFTWITTSKGLAQFTEQEIKNGTAITATGDVTLTQDAAGSQAVLVNGIPIEGDGIYRTSTGQVVVNDGRITATGDVNVTQRASGQQNVVIERPSRGGSANVCSPGAVLANPDTGELFYQGNDCCWWPVPQPVCRKGCGG